MASLTLWGLLSLLSLCHGQNAEELLLGEIQKLSEAISNQKTELLANFEEAKFDWQTMTNGTKNDVATLQHLLDIDECSNLSHNCSEDATCIDTRVSFRCKCKQGFTGDGYTCEDIDECTNRFRCGHYATCKNIPGKYSCACLPGFRGNGSTCEDIDECSEGINKCHKFAICKNTRGSYTCKCTYSHRGNGFICRENRSVKCDKPYEYVRGVGCIHIIERQQDFSDSREECQNLGGDLFVAVTPQQYLTLAKYFIDTNQKARKKYMYVGVKEGLWLNGRKVDPTEEAPGNPSMDSGTCSYTDGDAAEKFLLWTNTCHEYWPALCEQKR